MAMIGASYTVAKSAGHCRIVLGKSLCIHFFKLEAPPAPYLPAKFIGPIAKPDKIQIVPGLPKTRSGKIMRRILRKVAEGDTSNLGDISTLLDPTVVEEIKAGALI